MATAILGQQAVNLAFDVTQVIGRLSELLEFIEFYQDRL